MNLSLTHNLSYNLSKKMQKYNEKNIDNQGDEQWEIAAQSNSEKPPDQASFEPDCMRLYQCLWNTVSKAVHTQ